MEKIAKDEYRVTSVIKTPLFDRSCIVKFDKNLYIFYYAIFKPFETLALGHEIGQFGNTEDIAEIIRRDGVYNAKAVTYHLKGNSYVLNTKDRNKLTTFRKYLMPFSAK